MGSGRAGTGPSALPVPARFGLSALAYCRGLVAAGEALDGRGGVARVGEELQVAGGGGVDVTPGVLAGGVLVGGEHQGQGDDLGAALTGPFEQAQDPGGAPALARRLLGAAEQNPGEPVGVGQRLGQGVRAVRQRGGYEHRRALGCGLAGQEGGEPFPAHRLGTGPRLVVLDDPLPFGPGRFLVFGGVGVTGRCSLRAAGLSGPAQQVPVGGVVGADVGGGVPGGPRDPLPVVFALMVVLGVAPVTVVLAVALGV